MARSFHQMLPIYGLAAMVAACSSPAEPAPAPVSPVARTTEAQAPSGLDALASARDVRVVFEGNEQVKSEELARLLSVTRLDVSPAKRQEALERDILWLHAAYYDRGFVRVAIAAPRITPASGRGESAEIRIVIHEGPPFRVGSFHVHDDAPGAAVVSGDLEAHFRTHAGDVFNRATMVEDLEAMRRFYRDAGYSGVELAPITKIDDSRQIIDVDVPVRRGQVADR